ncbi:MAG: hypothetical protein AB8G05_13280 [Oligoflexales bacterium]
MFHASARSQVFFGIQNISNKEVLTPITVYGRLEATNCRFGNLDLSGDALFNDTIVNSVFVKGNFSAKKLSTKKIEVVGNVETDSSTINRASVTGNRVVFSNTKLDEIILRSKNDEEQVLILKNRVSVASKIEFESGKGKIIVDSTVALPANIIGATIVNI